MKILMINIVCGIRSTGRICTDLATELENQGHEVKIAYGRYEVPKKFQKFAVKIGSDFDVKLHALKARLFDACGFGSRNATKKFIVWVKKFNPDVIHIHNIHGYYINIEILFDYLRTCGKKIIWTLHDCWALTGHTAYCDAVNCKKFTTGCGKCPGLKNYPKSFIDRSASNWIKKKKIFCGIPNMTIVTPSNWLAGLVKKSFLSEYPVKVIHNGIDTSKFFPMENDFRDFYRIENIKPAEKTNSVKEFNYIYSAENSPADFSNENRQGYWEYKNSLGLIGKKIILGVSALWEKRKGLDDIIKLSNLLTDAKIILVGLNEAQKKFLPADITAYSRTNNVEELRKLYAAADFYINPTYEDNYPTTNLEAIACGTPVITYDTGGSPESANIYGWTVPKGRIDLIASLINNNKIPSKDGDVMTLSGMIKEYSALY